MNVVGCCSVLNEQSVAAFAADQRAVTCAAAQVVVACVAVKDIRARASNERVVACTTIDGIVAASCVDRVVACIPVDRIVDPVSTVDLIAIDIGKADVHRVISSGAVHGFWSCWNTNRFKLSGCIDLRWRDAHKRDAFATRECQDRVA